MSDHQKLGIILENKEVQKLSLENNTFTKKWYPKLIFFNDFFLIRLIFDILTPVDLHWFFEISIRTEKKIQCSLK